MSSPKNSKEIQKTYNMKDFVISTVLHVDSLKRTVTVKNMRDQNLTLGIAQSNAEFTLPPNAPNENWECLVHYGAGKPYIMHFIPPGETLFTSDEQLDKSRHSYGAEQDIQESITKTGKTYRSYNEKRRNLNYRAGKPIDAIPGDIGWIGPDGNFIGILRGPMNHLYVSDLCQIIQTFADQLTTIISENMEIKTGWGTISYRNDSGNTKLHLKCADNNEKVKAQAFDMELEVGAASDGNFISFKYMGANNQPVIFTVDEKSRVFFNTGTDVITVIGEDQITGVTGKSTEIIGDNKKIKAKTTQIITDGNASTKIGNGTGDHPNDTLVTYPHLEKIEELVDKVNNIYLDLFTVYGAFFLLGGTPQFINPLSSTQPFNPSDPSGLLAFKQTIIGDHTNIMVGK